MYHDLYLKDKSESGFQNDTALKYKVEATAFEAQVKAVAEYLDRMLLPKDSVDFTFDDGGLSFYTIAAPILEKYGLKGKFYISTAYIGTAGFLDEAGIKELHKRGHYVGSHSHTHPERMTALSQEEIEQEWSTSQTSLREILGFVPKIASIPNGYSSKDVLEAMIQSGIETIDTSATTTKIMHYESAVLRGRYAVTEDVTVEQLMQIVSSPLCRFKKRMRYEVLELAKAMLGRWYLTIREKLLRRK